MHHKFRRIPTILTWDNRGRLSLNVLTFDLDAGGEQMEVSGHFPDSGVTAGLMMPSAALSLH